MIRTIDLGGGTVIPVRDGETINMKQLHKNQIVLYRDYDDEQWMLSQVAMTSPLCFKTLSGHTKVNWHQIIPYEGNEDLVGTTNNPKPVPQIGEWWKGTKGKHGAEMVLFYDNNRKWVQAANWVTYYEDFIPTCKMTKA